MITFERASRWYGQVIGLNDLTCQIPVGLTALLGPNGAGKSTLLKLVTGQLRPTTGYVSVLGENPYANTRVYRRMGYCPEIESSYDEMTGRDFVRLMASLSGLPAQERGDRVEQALQTVGMAENGGRKIGGYSKGMRQRIKIAQAIVHDPEVLILDEPLNGLDPVGRHEMSSLLKDLAAKGKCVVISSHILHEVEQMTTRILLLHRGRLLAQGDLYHIRSLIDSHPHRIAITAENARGLAKRLIDLPYVLSVHFAKPDSSEVEVETNAPEAFYTQFPDIVLETGCVVRRFGSEDNNLDAVFKYLVTG
jgi:ABC-2 type transport system ATP-binding protein